MNIKDQIFENILQTCLADKKKNRAKRRSIALRLLLQTTQLSKEEIKELSLKLNEVVKENDYRKRGALTYELNDLCERIPFFSSIIL
ncbi:MAG: hypothetical protein AABY22_36200 [Nanoarchaeota archaeon]